YREDSEARGHLPAGRCPDRGLLHLREATTLAVPEHAPWREWPLQDPAHLGRTPRGRRGGDPRAGAGTAPAAPPMTPGPFPSLVALWRDVRITHCLESRGARPSPNGHVIAAPRGDGRVPREVLLARALEQAATTGRNNSGFWLACQSRDNGYAQTETEDLLRLYASHAPEVNPQGEHAPYTEAEALASVRQAYSRQPRAPWFPKQEDEHG